ncbi:hypothetical protein GQ473_03750, partial [archaeon]|nr:hypothetical protein [archaeon]
MKSKTGWYNKNKSGRTVKYESHRHSLASKGIKTALPKGAKNVSFSGSPTPNFDMVKKGKEEFRTLKDLDRKIKDFNIGNLKSYNYPD